MKRLVFGFAIIFSLLLAASGWADDEHSAQIGKSQNPDEVKIGEIKFKLNSDYCKVLVDGEGWEDDTVFENNGFTAYVYRIDRTKTHKIKLIPANPNLEPVEIEITPKMWKLAPYKHGIRVWRITKRIKFKKKSSKKKK